MTRSPGRRRILWIACCGLVVASCAGDSRPAADGPVVVLAVTGLAPPLEEIFRGVRRGSDARVRAVYGTESSLAKRIDAGEEADLFICGNPLWTKWLRSHGRLDDRPERVLAEDRLVVVAAKDGDWTFDPAAGTSLTDAFEGSLALGDPDETTFGAYAKQALEHAGWWADLEFRVLARNDAPAVLFAVERGHADAGIVYASAVRDSGAVRVVASIPESWHARILYPLTMVGGRRRPVVDRVWDTLTSDAAAEIFRRHGFRPVGEPAQTR
jgi:molybdate transport system substrate-binding protein